jgi:predicted ATPase
MDILDIDGYSLKNLNNINIVLGKNGCGKSIMLRSVNKKVSTEPGVYGKSVYITPERGGFLIVDSGVEQRITNDDNWLLGQRSENQSNSFRQQSIAQYKKLRLLILQEIDEKEEVRAMKDYHFSSYIDKINSLLDNIEIKTSDITFKIYKKGTADELRANQISSGESELICLAIECLLFSKECVLEKENILFLDEPDVHLHPDIQFRLISFLRDLVLQTKFKILIATHSTAILGALQCFPDTHLAFMLLNQRTLEFSSISNVYRKILPVFGAHPLSNVFNEVPPLLVDGEDDERIWQQAVRSSDQKIKIYPCSVEGCGNMNDFEQEAQKIMSAVYDKAICYSLRDRDESPDEEIDDLSSIVRMKLSCRNAENLLLSDEVLNSLDLDWIKAKSLIDKWLERNNDHHYFDIMEKFKNDGYDRKNYNLKEIRNILVGIMGSNKPWEVIVGKEIAKLSRGGNESFSEEGKIISYLGKKLVDNLIPKLEN